MVTSTGQAGRSAWLEQPNKTRIPSISDRICELRLTIIMLISRVMYDKTIRYILGHSS